MGTYTQILYQIVFSTKYRERTLEKRGRDEMFKQISGTIRNKKCHLYQIGGVSDHIHIVTHLHPSIALSDLVKDIKMSSTDCIKNKKLFQNFRGWQDGYSAFTYSISAKKNLINYVMNQEKHHGEKTYLEELIELYKEHEIEFDEKYLL